MEDSVSQRKLFIGGLASHTTKESLAKHFEKYGQVQDSILMVDRISGRSRCFGFIIMQDPSALDRILSEAQHIDEKLVDCKRAVPRDSSHSQIPAANASFKTNKMFVGGLPADVTNDMFKEFFSQFGEIEDSIVILDKDTGRSRGFGFITFKYEESAERVLENYENNMINGKWVECKKATPKVNQPSYPTFSMPYMMHSTYSNPYVYENYAPHIYNFSTPEFWPSTEMDKEIDFGSAEILK